MIYRLLGGVGVLAFAVVALILFGNSRYHSGQLAERAIWQARTAAAELSATKAASKIEQSQVVEQQRSSDAIEVARAAGRADALRHVAGLRQSPDIHIDLPAFAGATEAVAGAGQTAELDDATICADNTVNAEQWQEWWTGSAVPR